MLAHLDMSKLRCCCLDTVQMLMLGTTGTILLYMKQPSKPKLKFVLVSNLCKIGSKSKCTIKPVTRQHGII